MGTISWGVVALLLIACEIDSSATFKSTGRSEEEVWDVTGLVSPVDDMAPPRAGMCAIGLICATDIYDEPKVACRVAIADQDGLIYDSFAGVEKRGRSSLLFDKPNYGMELRDENANNNAVDVMGMGKDEDWILDGSWVDRSFVRNQLLHDLFASFGPNRYGPEARYCTLSLNGDYRGIYRLGERPKRDASRINIQRDTGSGESFVIRQGNGGPLDFRLGLEAAWELTYPNEKAATDDQLIGIQRWLDVLDEALTERSADRDEGAFDLLDDESVADWIIAQEFSRNIDAYKLSVHLYKDVDKRAQLVPWDFDLAFGQPIVAPGAPEPEGAEKSNGWVSERTQFVQDVLAIPGFAEQVAERWKALREHELADETVFSLIDEYQETLEPELEANFERWPLERVRFEHVYPPYSLYAVDSYQEELERLRRWISDRLAWLDANIDTLADSAAEN